MRYKELLHKNLHKILQLTKEQVLVDNEILGYVQSKEKLETLLDSQLGMLRTYLEYSESKNKTELEHFCWHFYKELVLPYSLIYKCMQIVKQNLINIVYEELQTKEEVIAIEKYFGTLVNTLAKVYIKKDVITLKEVKTSVFYKYLLIRAHEKWIDDLVKAIVEDNMEIFPLTLATECAFHHYLDYPESMMVCLDANHCKLLHKLHDLIHQTANSFYLFYKQKDFTQAYIIFKELVETILKFNKVITELYLVVYSDVEENLFKFIEMLLLQKDMSVNLTMIDIKRLKLLNKNYGERNIDKLIEKFDNQLFSLIKNNENKMLIVKGTMADYYILDFGYTMKNSLYEMTQQIYKIMNNEYKINNDEINVESIVVSLNLKGFYGKTRTDLTKLMFYLKEKASSLKSSLVIEEQSQKEELLFWLKKEYENVDFIAKKLDEKAVDVMFQPIFSIQTGDVEVVEALARIVDNDGSLISAGVFIDTIYQMNRIEELDRLVLQKIQSYKKELHMIAKTIFINISYQSLTNVDYQEEFKSFMKSFSDENVVFELTEQTIVENVKDIIALHKIYDVYFAVDDFGSGYSSLKTVSDLARHGLLKILKIDETLVKNLKEDLYDRKIVNVISQLSTALDLYSVGEFIENKEVLEQLKLFGVTYAQGFYLSKPRKIEDLVVAKLNESLNFDF